MTHCLCIVVVACGKFPPSEEAVAAAAPTLGMETPTRRVAAAVPKAMGIYVPYDDEDLELKNMNEWRMLSKHISHLTQLELQQLRSKYPDRLHKLLTERGSGGGQEKFLYRDFLNWLFRPNGIFDTRMTFKQVKLEKPLYHAFHTMLVRRNGPDWVSHVDVVLGYRLRNVKKSKEPKALAVDVPSVPQKSGKKRKPPKSKRKTKTAQVPDIPFTEEEFKDIQARLAAHATSVTLC